MSTVILTSNIDQLIARIQAFRARLMPTITGAVTGMGQEVQQNLSQNAPKGMGEEGIPPEGDAPGRLSESFGMAQESDEASVSVTVRTSQPLKLQFVTKGTGIYGEGGMPITPKVKKALYWQGAAHPVRSVRGMQANDFVTPITDNATETLGERLEAALSELAAEL